MPALRPYHLLATLGILVVTACSPSAPAGPPPPVVLISLDTLRADHLGCYGYPRATSPSLDALAGESWLFERCYATAPWTLVSHVSMLSGLFPGQHGVARRTEALAPDVPTLAERLAERGYQTWGWFHDGWMNPRHGFGRGFEVYEPHRGIEALDMELRRAHRDLREDERPLFLFLHTFEIHAVPMLPKLELVYEPPEPYRDLFVEGAAERFEEGDAVALYEGLERPTDEQLEALVALYDGCIRYVDDYLGGFFERWRGRGLYEEALIVVTSDHGESLGQRGGVLEGHGGLFEEGLHVPLIVKPPGGAEPPRRVTEPVNHVDIVPTILRFAGAPIDDWLPGRRLDGEPRRPGEVMAAAWHADRAYVAWPEKVIVSSEDKRPTALFDLASDPDELAGRVPADDPQQFDARLADLERRYRDAVESLAVPADGPVPVAEVLSAEEAAMLEALGYKEGDER